MTGVSGTITLTSTASVTYPTATTNSVTFTAAPGSGLTVSGNNLYQVFLIENGSATFQNFTVADGFVNATGGCTCDPGYGAGIYAYTGVNLTLTNMVITGNSAANGAGGVLAAGPLTVTGTTFSNNSAPASGGGLAGALYAIGSPATIYQSTFSGNSAWIGSAIYTYTPVTLTISDSTFANNQAGTKRRQCRQRRHLQRQRQYPDHSRQHLLEQHCRCGTGRRPEQRRYHDRHRQHRGLSG